MKHAMQIKGVTDKAVACLAVACASFVLTFRAGAADARVIVNSDGLYAISSAELAGAMGYSESQIQSWLQNKQIAIENRGRTVAAMYTSNSVSFFGEAYATRFTTQNVYWAKAAPGVAADSVSSSSASYVAGQTSPARALIEKNLVMDNKLVKDVNTCPWLWVRLLPASSFTKTLSAPFELPGVVTGGKLIVRVQGFGGGTGSNTMTVTLNNALNNITLGSFPLVGQTYVAWTTSVSTALFVPGTGNTLKITASVAAGQSVYVDNFEFTYARANLAVSNALVFVANGNNPLTVGGFTSDAIEVYDVTDPADTFRVTDLSITSAAGLYAASFHPANGSNRYIAVAGGLRRAPQAVMADIASNLRSQANEADYLAITRADFASHAQTLANYRSIHGLGALAVDVQDIYDEFNYGIADPRAIKAFIGYAYRMWARAPRYACLMGGGTLDYKNFSGNNDCVVPAMPTSTTNGQISTDAPFGDVDGDGAADVAIGRIPGVIATHFQNAMGKIQVYETGGAWKNTAVGLADQPDGAGNFSLDSDSVLNLMSGVSVEKVYVATQSVTTARSNVISSLNAGRGIFTYVGHADQQKLSLQASPGLLANTDTTNLFTSAHPTFMLAMTCLVGTYSDPSLDSLGEALVLCTNGVAAMFGSGELVYNADNVFLARPLVSNLYQNGVARLGDAIIAAEKEAVGAGRVSICTSYNLLGDPALAVGDMYSSRPGPLFPTNMPSYNEWKSWAIAPVASDAGAGQNPNGDDDGDGLSNNAEYLAGTDALNANSLLSIVEQKRASGNKVSVKWNSAQHRLYDLERSTSVTGQYTVVGSGLSALPPFNTYTDSVSSAVYFYRIRLK